MFSTQILTLILLITLIVFVITLTILQILSIRYIRYITSKLDDQSRLLYIMDKRCRRYEEHLNDTDESITSLSTSVASLASGYQKQLNTRILPKPELVEQITKTITDLLSIEVGLSKNMRASRKESVQLIVENTIKTYPDVNPDYITKKTLSIIEAYTSEQ